MLRTQGPEPVEVQEALTQELDGVLSDDPVLMRLSALSDQVARLPISVGLNLVLEASGLRMWAEQMTEAPQARADILRLEAEAEAFEQAHRDLKAASGFHGETAKVFLGWLDARAGDRDFDRHPDPSGESSEAVEIVTWHGSKGREWPITVVAEFDNAIEERPGTTSTKFESLDRIDDMAAVLDSASLIHTPVFDAPEAQARFLEDRRADFEATARNLLYVALTRARDRLILEWPTFLKDRNEDAPGASCLFHVLSDNCLPKIGNESLRIGSIECAVRHVYVPEVSPCTTISETRSARHPRFGLSQPLPLGRLSPWRLLPSQAVADAAVPLTRSIRLGAALPTTVNTAVRGTALHLAFRTFLTRPDLMSRLDAATGLDSVTLELIATRARAFKDLLASMGFTDLRCEVPVLGHTPEGAEIPGIIDLLAMGLDGCLLIDHKSGGTGVGLGSYWHQLSAYIQLIPEIVQSLPLKGAGILWLDHGTLELVDL